ncbi:c-type cytochrome [Pontiella sp.]|uniref:c-type cytochrome n=1 Tax=Pontiella sp. TaxID=2837462 RepID=UPI0035668791
MKRIRPILISLAVLSAAAAETFLSPCDIDLSNDRKNLHITAATANQILTFDLRTRKVMPGIPLPGQPTGLTLNAAGTTWYVTGGGHEGRVWQVQAGSITAEFKTGHTPTAPVLSPDGGTLYVCNQFDNDVSFIDTASGKTRARVPAIREPNAAGLTPDGKTLFVANLLPDGRADADYVAAKITAIDTLTQTTATIPLVNGAEGVRGIKVSPDGRFVFATHRIARYLVPTTQLERGWISTDAVSIIRVSDRKLIYTVLLDDIDQGFTNPWAIDFSNDGKTLIITSAGNHEISLIDYRAMMERVAGAASDTGGMESSNLSFLSGIRERIKLEGNGPRSIEVDGEFIYVANCYSDTLEVVRRQPDGKIKRGSFALGPAPAMTQERLGEIYFNDAALCFQNWLSCATCHPDARTDGLNWDLLNDGIGNPKNAKSMLLTHATPRAMWLGVRDDAETGVRAGLKHIQFSVRPDEDAQAIDAYLKSLTPVPSPYLVDGQLSAAAQRGKALFEGMSCASCHPAPLYTNLELIDVGTTKGQDTGKPVDVPSLIEAWRTAPYLHDGRAATIHDVLKSQDHAGILKNTQSLTDQERNDLAEYILSL